MAPKTIFFDVDNQIDFLYPAGALFVPGAEKLAAHLRALTKFAASNQIQIISTMDAHSEDDPEFKVWKPHCVAGTTGQQKASGTLLPRRIVLTTGAGALDKIRHLIATTPQILVEKQQLDCFSNPNLTPLLEQLDADHFVVYGVVTEYCVGCAIAGLLNTGARVELVGDAIQSLAQAAAQETLMRFKAGGGHITSVHQVTAER